MPPISPCGLVVDFLRSCFTGFWRFFPSRPDILTPGKHYFAADTQPSIVGFHPFGSGVWNKDGSYPEYPVGQLMRAGSRWTNGQEPNPIPPPNQLFPTPAYAADQLYPPSPVVTLRGGFDQLCWTVFHPGFDVNTDAFLRPNLTNCCWQRVLMRLVELLSYDDLTGRIIFLAAIDLLWPGYTVLISGGQGVRDRFCKIEGPNFVVMLFVGVQEMAEIWDELVHGLPGPVTVTDALATQRTWWNLTTTIIQTWEAWGFSEGKPMWFVGHSKGGVKAWLLAHRLANWTRREIHVMTFGSPKIGNEVAAGINGITEGVHLVHRLDGIPRLPPSSDEGGVLEAILSTIGLTNWLRWRGWNTVTNIGAGLPTQQGPVEDLPVFRLVEYLEDLIRWRVPEPIEEHFIRAYVSALADCCPAPVFPFSITFWNFIFGAPQLRAAGGGAIGPGNPNGFKSGSGGLEIGGGLPFRIGSGGIQLGGFGAATYTQTSEIILETGFYILLESGFLIDLE